MDLDIAGNAGLVTASSSGLGKAAATALAREGVDVVINGRDEDRLAEAATEIEAEATGSVVQQPGDITDPDDISALVNRAVDEFDRLDHVVTSAGGPPSGRFLDIPESEWYDTYDLLVMSVVRLIHEATPHLQAGDGGTIVNITSISVKEAIDALVLSNSVRMSVIGLEKTLSTELAPEIRVNAILPGTHETPRIEELLTQAVDRGDFESYEAAREARGADIPVGHIGDPMNLGELAAFLSSPRAAFINGIAIPVDGGSSGSNL